MLGFECVVQESYAMTLARKSFLPMIVTRGSDQGQISSGFQTRSDPANIRNYGNLVIEFSKLTPSDLGMAKLFTLPSDVLRSVAVKGDLIISETNRKTIMTRSKTKKSEL